MGNKEFARQFKYYPNYIDMRDLCHDNGFDSAHDFEDVPPMQAGDKAVYGVVYTIGYGKVGEYLITMLTDEPVALQELLR